MLEWVELLVIVKEFAKFGMDEAFHDFGDKTCETDWPIVTRGVLIIFLKDRCNIRSCSVLGQGATAH